MTALTGGVVGDGNARRDDAGSLAGTPIFLGCSDSDPHVPLWRVEETHELLRRMGAQVERRIYPGMPHTVIRDELDWVESAMRQSVAEYRCASAHAGAHSG